MDSEKLPKNPVCFLETILIQVKFLKEKALISWKELANAIQNKSVYSVFGPIYSVPLHQ